MIWACPICRQPLQASSGGVSCSANHQFDRAKQGYLPLLPAHHRRSATPGDDRAMLEGRREFLQAGFYAPLADLLAEQLCGVGESRESVTLLDSGCGEGYYLGRIMARARDLVVRLKPFGFDISKDAAKLSARALSADGVSAAQSRGANSADNSVDTASIAVASSFQLPVLDESVDVVLRIFSPGDMDEVARVLRADGEFWRVVPGPKHLYQLKQALYDEVTLHEIPASPEGFETFESTPLVFPVELTNSQAIEQLLQMTPFVWRGSEQGKAVLRESSALTVTADFVLQRYRKVAV
ncbi:MAG: putative RNA methyltransferase [Cellvibrionaceae bacterium]